MGHDEMVMTDYYTEFDPEEVQGVVGRLDISQSLSVPDSYVSYLMLGPMYPRR